MLSSEDSTQTGKKGKFSVTPPSSPNEAVASFSPQPNGYRNTAYTPSPRHASLGSENDVDGHIDGQFKFLESQGSKYPDVFTISGLGPGNRESSDSGKTNTLSSNVSNSRSPVSTLNRDSGFSEDKYRWTEGPDVKDGGDAQGKNPEARTSGRRVCCVVVTVVLVCAIIAAIVAVVIVFVVNKKEDDVIVTTLRPDSLVLEGSLALNQTWSEDLANSSSQLYITTAANFTAEIDAWMLNSSFAEVYTRTEVIAFSPGSIQVDFLMTFTEQYRKWASDPNQYAALVENAFRLAAFAASKVINGTVQINTRNTTTPMTPITSTTSTSVTTSTMTSPVTTISNMTSTSSSASTESSPTTTLSNVTSTSSSSSTESSPTTTTSNLTSSTLTQSTVTSTTSTTTKTTTTIITEAPDFPPTANAGNDVTVRLPVNSIKLDGSGSTDDRRIASYLWRVVLPVKATVILTNEQSPIVTVSNFMSGTYVFSLAVQDDKFQTSTDNVTVIVLEALTTTTTTKTTTTMSSTSPTTLSTTTTVSTTTTMTTTTMAGSSTTSETQGKCALATFSTCLSRGFKWTVYPNLLGQSSPEEAEAGFVRTARDVINQVCEEVALRYLCSLYFTQCDLKTGNMIFPCASLCHEANATCGAHFIDPMSCDYWLEEDCVGLTPTTPRPSTTTPPEICEPTIRDECKALGFNQTYMPNIFGEPDQVSASETFDYIITNYGSCHDNFTYFLCSIQYPVCADRQKFKPCRSFCNEIMSACPDVKLYFPKCETFPDVSCIAPRESPIECDQNEFSCGSVARCVNASQVCDGVNQCGDWSDEMNCVCHEHQWRCNMGMCIKSYQRCDNTSQCPDNSDEQECGNCTHGQVSCPSGKCIMTEWLCDGRAECEDTWDEYNCDQCGRNQFSCMDRNQTCVPLADRCNGFPNCPNSFDEFQCISDDYGIIQLPVRKTELPLCADSWFDDYGNYTCQLLGKGIYLGFEAVSFPLNTFASLSATGTIMSVLGTLEISQCPSNKALKVNCEPRGCGRRQITLENYMSGGDDASPGAWPWHVALEQYGQYFCGGTLIAPEFVLTAAHCVEDKISASQNMTVVMGTNDRSKPEMTRKVVSVEAVSSHAGHVYYEKNDIALLQLSSPIMWTDHVQPACLPTAKQQVPLYSTCYTVGWGWEKWGGTYRDVLQQLKMTVWDMDKCNSSLAWNGRVSESSMCAGYYSGVRSICRGDSGGSLVCDDGMGTWTVHGISSYVANFCNMTERPNIFTDVQYFLPWLQERTECVFKCGNGKCLYRRSQLCNREDNCGDNSDEILPCNRSVTCDFEDDYLCGYDYTGWNRAQDNKLSTQMSTAGQLHTQSAAPQFDHTIGRPPGHYMYGKLAEVSEGNLASPRFTVATGSCLRFAFYMRGEIQLGLTMYFYTYETGSDKYVYNRKWPTSPLLSTGTDEWRTGYVDVNTGDYKLEFRTGDLLRTAVDDVELLPGQCDLVLCKSDEFRCRVSNKCIPRLSRCNIVVDCDDAKDEMNCGSSVIYTCSFENGNLCGLRQEVGDGTDWWLVSARFLGQEVANSGFVDHTFGTRDGHVFYINDYGIQSSEHILTHQQFKTGGSPHCFSLYYMMEVAAIFNIHFHCIGCETSTHIIKPSFDGRWAKFQTALPLSDIINVTYDVIGKTEGYLFRKFIAMDDINVQQGACPDFICPMNYTKCRTTDRCIPDRVLCDRNVDCLDEFDEENCVCNETEFRCNNTGRCIPALYVCDRVPHCSDGYDEGAICSSLDSVSCTFEHPYMCGYVIHLHTDFRWAKHKGSTATPVTGPQSDHTLGNSEGYYMYTEAGEGKKGDNSSLESPPFSTGSGSSLLFWYHIYSDQPFYYQPGKLLVEVLDTESNEVLSSWQNDPLELIDAWLRVCFLLPSNRTARVIFTSIRNENTTFGVDIAIDDVTISTQTCDDVTLPPTTTKVPDDGSCKTSEWKCASGQCLLSEYRCDGTPDCRDMSDEQGCAITPE